MRNFRLRTFASSVLALAIAGSAYAQTTTTTTTTSKPTAASTTTSRTDRLFLAFAEEATLAETQWWEGQVEFQGGEVWDSTIARLVVAFQPWHNIEVGGRVGFGSTSADGGISDGTGGTDLDAWGKYRWDQGDTDFAAGALVTVPTGDNTAGLGHDAFDLELFGSVRHRAANWIADGEAGLRFNGDGSVGGFDYNGDVSVFLGGGVIVPLSDVFSLVGELRLETSRIDNGDDDARLLGGMHWRLGSGVVRAAVGFGLTDGAPDYQIIGGYAWVF